jgi:2,4-dienoyl-CoA reductase-like NADH-dependent reductase (Old Yellow Enzyme family)
MSLSPAFSPLQLGPVKLLNRFMRSATHEALSDDSGFPSPKLLSWIERLASGNVGLIVPGYVYASESGRAASNQTGMESEAHGQAWKSTISRVHAAGSKLMFQIAHGGVASPSRKGPSALSPFASALTVGEIDVVIESFRKAAVYCYRAGADGVELHSAHGYLFALFLSPLTNRRKDKYGGSPENRVRIVEETVREIRKATDKGFGIGIKMNGVDSMPWGVKPELCAEYVRLLKKNVDFFEISSGLGNFLSTIRFAPVGFVSKCLAMLNPWEFTHGYNLKAAAVVKKRNPDAVVAAVGGWRDLDYCNEAIRLGEVDMVSISRAFIREPDLVKQWKEGRTRAADCKSCNACILGMGNPEKGLACTYP